MSGADLTPVPGSPEADAKRSIPGGSFFRSRWVEEPPGVEQLDPAQLAPGFRAGGVHAGLKKSGGTDVGLLVCDAPEVSSAMVLTRNAAAAAPIRVCRNAVAQSRVRAAVVNSGNANAETGEKGYQDAFEMVRRAADALGLGNDEVAVAETGTIGVPLPIETVLDGIDEAATTLSPSGGTAFSDAITTTDRWPKRVTLRVDGVTLSAQAKGAGMIEPNMATMLCFVQTDAVLDDPVTELRRAVDVSFNRITVDGQMSTNDTVLLQGTGAAGKPLPEGLLTAILTQLAIEIVRDGEGAARAGRITVSEAATPGEAERVAREIANSPLVKTALYGRDPNWGRLVQATGKALAGEEMEELGADAIDADELAADTPEANVGVRLGRGEHSAHVYFSDLGHEYVTLNAEYTT